MKTPFKEEKVYLEATVLECREKIPNELYQIRMQFKNVSPEAAEILLKAEQHGEKI